MEENRVQGRDGVKQFLRDNPEICDRIEARVREEAWRLSPQRAQRPAAAPVTAPVDIVAEDFDQG